LCVCVCVFLSHLPLPPLESPPSTLIVTIAVAVRAGIRPEDSM
jgi:hypothetical protein